METANEKETTPPKPESAAGEDSLDRLVREISRMRVACENSASTSWHMLNLMERLHPVPKPKHRVLDSMTDVEGARRLLIMWVPKSAGKAWMRFPWGFRAGRLWVQFSPNAEAIHGEKGATK